MNKIVALIVIYNKKISDSNAYKSLSTYDNIDIIISDNSTINNDNDLYAKENNINYINNHGNIGLSKAYNQAIKFIKDNLTNYTHILLCDDDTLITQQYIDEINELSNQGYDLIIPKIINKSNNELYSPRVYNHTSLITKPYDGGNYKHIKAINSGLCINLNIFDNFKYNEDNFLYFVDVDFFDNYVNKHDIKMIVAKPTLLQELSHFDEDININQMRLRLSDSKKYNNFFVHSLYKTAFILSTFIRTKNKEVLKLFR